jgi:soluble lytic murein transglycosylase-like protein
MVFAIQQRASAASAPGTPDVPRLATVVHGDPRSGRLVRTVVIDPTVIEPVAVEPVDPSVPAAAAADAPETPEAAVSLPELAEQIARLHGVEDSLVHSVILAESNYNPRAVSPKGALGIMQLIPETARRFGVGNAFDPRQNIEGGVRYLKFLLEYYHGNYPKAIAAYNAGEGAVDRYNGIPPYVETREYVIRVARNLKAARAEHARRPAQPATVASLAPQSAANAAETHKPVRASIGSDGLVYYGNP